MANNLDGERPFFVILLMSADGQDVLPEQKPSPCKSGCRQHAQKSSGLCTVRYPTAKLQIARFKKKFENPLEFPVEEWNHRAILRFESFAPPFFTSSSHLHIFLHVAQLTTCKNLFRVSLSNSKFPNRQDARLRR